MAKLKANQFKYRPGLVITERPILFQTDMVQAILEGRKTQTRRTNSLYYINNSELSWIPIGTLKSNSLIHGFGLANLSKRIIRVENIKCPYGQPGDLLWVRESFGTLHGQYLYKANYKDGDDIRIVKDMCFNGWKPSIHMPKYAARIWLMVTEIYIEKLKELEPTDCGEEGIEELQIDSTVYTMYKNYTTDKFTEYYPISSFRSLWISINGKESWDSNPWVWVVKFRVLSCSGKPDLQTIQKNYLDILSE